MRSVYDYIPTIICFIICVYILVSLYRTAIKEGRSLKLILFAFAVAGLLLSSLYWVAFDLLYPTERMPFAANEIAECALFLSLAATLATMLTSSIKAAKWEIGFAILFMAANVALWIAWSGEWLQDIITGIVFGYFLINLVRLLKETEKESLTVPVRVVIALFCVMIVAANAATFFVPESLTARHDLAAYILLSIVEGYLMIRVILSLWKKSEPRVCVSLSFSLVAWSLIFMYMSAGMFYNIANICLSLSFLLSFFSLRREVRL